MAARDRHVLTGAQVVLPGRVADGARVVVEGTRITHVSGPAPGEPDPRARPGARPGPAAGTDGAGGPEHPFGPGRALTGPGPDRAAVVDLSGHWLVPGFVDIHNHGGGGASFTNGSAADILTGVRTHRLHGTTTVVASTVTGAMDALAERAGLLSELAEQGEIAGIHFEGPFISPCRKGAHAEDLLRDPDPAEVRKLLDAARGHARMVTLAPELPGGLDAVRLLAEHGVIAALGHTDAGYDETVAAIDAGATVATHLFNAMPPLAHRAPGPVAALLEDERITVELINDGTHLHPAALRLAFHRAGAARVAFITDAMDAAGFGDGTYRLGPMAVEVTDGVARLAGSDAIAGSTLTLDRAFQRAATVDRLPVQDIVRVLSQTPARLLGCYDRVGSLEAGKDADLVVLDADFALVGVMHKGTWVVHP
jgi:N-acetylglucosamine-6-phosphate deacetylase